MCLKYKKSNCHWTKSLGQQRMVSCKKLFQINKIAQRFSHFLSVNGNHIVVHPIFHTVLAQSRFILGNLTFVVRKHQIHSTTVYIKLFAQVFSSHSRTFQMPSRKTLTPRCFPMHNVLWRCFFPQCKIYASTFFSLSIQLTCCFEHVVNISARKYAIVIDCIVFLHIKVNRTFTFVCKPCV